MVNPRFGEGGGKIFAPHPTGKKKSLSLSDGALDGGRENEKSFQPAGTTYTYVAAG